MNAFDNLESIWKQQSTHTYTKGFERVQSTRSTLKKRALWSCIGMVSLVIWIVWMVFISSNLQLSGLPLAANLLIILVLLIQAGYSAANYLRLARMHEDGNPEEQLRKWSSYYQQRTAYLKNMGPLFFFLLNGAFMLYLPTVLDTYPNEYYQIGFCIVYLLVMVGIWHGPAKLYLRKELASLGEISHNLMEICRQWDSLLKEPSAPASQTE